ncbi:AraC family transcriptional regulator [Bizionia argentinensis JUB59]|uniref:AraC family transcriptional regulator n=1 Tax=Bizionia argentinensis JUB59 TaxID=1046627 RepID=G2EG96_9FLAO|nr:helix-turn-helix domain-containing protein [Bizionia argentinensis]EGV42513.2 AraC family transcriptional regulator [Bizionia argentinensis JUB59]
MTTKKNISEYHQLPILDGLELLNAKSHTLDFPFHTHNTFNIALILENTFNIRLYDKDIMVPKGVLSIVHPNEVHATPCDKDLGNSFFTFYVSPEAIKDFNSGEPVFFEDKIIYDQYIFNELYSLSLHFKNNVIDFENRLIAVLKLLVTNYTSIKPIKFTTSKLFQSFIATTNFESFSLDKTASQFGLNKYKFIRLFKQEIGLTPNNYVLLKKIEKSKKMLKNGKPIFDVAIDCGFYDTSHFYKNFKRFTGVNPLDFQNALFIS